MNLPSHENPMKRIGIARTALRGIRGHRPAPGTFCLATVSLAFSGVLNAESTDSTWLAAPGSGVSAAYLAQLVIGLILVVLLIMALAYIMRRVNGGGHRLGTHFRVVSGISLGSRERMILVQVGETQLLVGVAPGRVQTLLVLDEPIALQSAAGDQSHGTDSPFARKLQGMLNRSSGS
jgi:flagellar protein FliO/FliZ